MHPIIRQLVRCYHAAQHPAVVAERPMHILYFIVVATHGEGLYRVIAMLCGGIMMLTVREQR